MLDGRPRRSLGLRILDLLEHLAHAGVHEGTTLGLEIVIAPADALGFPRIQVSGHGYPSSQTAPIETAGGTLWMRATRRYE